MSPEENCAIQSIAWLRGVPPAEIVKDMDAFHGGRDWLLPDCAVDLEAYGGLVTSRYGWRAHVPQYGKPFPLPSRALVAVPGHCFAVRDGTIFDTAAGEYRNNEPIYIVFAPPEEAE